MLRKIVTKAERCFSPILGRLLYPPSGSNVVCLENGKVVVLETDGEYRFPGGIVESGEHPEDAARREFKEETGLKAEIKNLITIETVFNQIKATHFFYKALLKEEFNSEKETWEGTPKLVKISELPEEMKKIAEKTQ